MNHVREPTSKSAYDATNQVLWDKWVPIHVGSSFYDVSAFMAGRSSLKVVEREALGDVRGKSILHLQCHFGLDSLSLARAGAIVTAVDYSLEGIRLGRKLSEQTGIPVTFVHANIYDLAATLDQRFDIVFTSYGVLHWLPDLAAWGRTIARSLAPSGFFYMVELHPYFNMLDEGGVHIVFPYFPSGEPLKTLKKGACVDRGAPVEQVAYEWPHSLSEILMGLVGAGLCIDDFQEYPFMVFNCLDYLERVDEGRYAPKDRSFDIPLMFSVRASFPNLDNHFTGNHGDSSHTGRTD